MPEPTEKNPTQPTEIQQHMTAENWATLCKTLANPQCNTCYGRGYTGWHTIPDGQPMPVLCTKRRCTLESYKQALRIQRIRELQLKKQAKEKTIEIPITEEPKLEQE